MTLFCFFYQACLIEVMAQMVESASFNGVYDEIYSEPYTADTCTINGETYPTPEWVRFALYDSQRITAQITEEHSYV